LVAAFYEIVACLAAEIITCLRVAADLAPRRLPPPAYRRAGPSTVGSPMSDGSVCTPDIPGMDRHEIDPAGSSAVSSWRRFLPSPWFLSPLDNGGNPR